MRKRGVLSDKKSLLTLHKEFILTAIEASGSKASWKDYIKIVIASAVGGFLIGMLFHNIFLSIIMTVALACVPSQYYMIKIVSYNRFLHAQIEDALTLITNRYRLNDDILTAIKENLENIEIPLRDKLSEFCVEVEFIDPNMINCIMRLRKKVNNKFFTEWCDSLIQCVDDSDLKSVLPSIIDKMNDTKKIQQEIDTTMTGIWRDHIIVSAMVLASVPLMRVLNVDWYNILINTLIGKILVCVLFVTVFLSTIYVMRINKPVSMEE